MKSIALLFRLLEAAAFKVTGIRAFADVSHCDMLTNILIYLYYPLMWTINVYKRLKYELEKIALFEQ